MCQQSPSSRIDTNSCSDSCLPVVISGSTISNVAPSSAHCPTKQLSHEYPGNPFRARDYLPPLDGRPDGSRVDGTMNALNIISSRVSPPPSPMPSRTNSLGSLNITVTEDGNVKPLDDSDEKTTRNAGDNTKDATDESSMLATASDSDSYLHLAPSPSPSPSENTPLLSFDNKETMGIRSSPSHLYPRGIATTLINSIRWVLSTLAAPGVYLIACLYTEDGEFSPLYQLRRLFTSERRSPSKLAASELEKDMNEKSGLGISPSEMRTRRVVGSGSSSSGLSSESESDIGRQRRKQSQAAGRRHSRAKSLEDDTEETTPARRSIRIKLHEESGKRGHRKTQSTASAARASRAQSKNKPAPTGTDGASDIKDISAQLKSPTSPVGALTRYPKTPAPPRPLIPRRQPSYINIEAPDKMHQKTLILDLDETLIHSMSKGGRMSTGHMVEVRLQQTITAGSATLGPQHPVLYYVHKRPHCDDFLRRVSYKSTSQI